jgi:hypothetical protein
MIFNTCKGHIETSSIIINDDEFMYLLFAVIFATEFSKMGIGNSNTLFKALLLSLPLSLLRLDNEEGDQALLTSSILVT